MVLSRPWCVTIAVICILSGNFTTAGNSRGQLRCQMEWRILVGSGNDQHKNEVYALTWDSTNNLLLICGGDFLLLAAVWPITLLNERFLLMQWEATQAMVSVLLHLTAALWHAGGYFGVLKWGGSSWSLLGMAQAVAVSSPLHLTAAALCMPVENSPQPEATR